MMPTTTFPPYGRLTRRFTEIGPYFRAPKSDREQFFFDCLAVCVSVKADPEKREFHGWWLTLDKTETGFIYRYQFGLYDNKGEWKENAIPKKYRVEVTASLQSFYEKLSELVVKEFELELGACDSLDKSLVLSAA